VFERLRDRDALPLPDPDTAADLMDLSHGLLRAAGYGRYEISNYALPGHASRHNRVYWSGAGWWGFGLGATAAPWGRRQARPRTREAYATWLDHQGAPSAGVEAAAHGAPSGEASPADQNRHDAAGSAKGQATLGMPFDELLLVGLRRREGVAIAEVAASAGLDGAAIAELRRHLADVEQAGLLRVEGPRWRLSDPEGLALSNAVLRALLAWWERRGSRSSPAAPRSPDPDRQAAAG
jgi:oxygen-independent coproporphyrinogen-3 oxidase